MLRMNALRRLKGGVSSGVFVRSLKLVVPAQIGVGFRPGEVQVYAGFDGGGISLRWRVERLFEANLS